jgi:hypothetical protein
MNSSLMMEMLAAQASSRGNPAVAELLVRLQSNAGADSEQTTQDLMANLAQANPVMGILARHMAEQSAARARREAEMIEAESVVAEVAAHPAAISEECEGSTPPDVAELRTHALSMLAELKVLREREDLLAAALGACCLCWGQDEDCRACRGRGRPGYSLPDEALFEELVLPAVQLLRTQRFKRGSAGLSRTLGPSGPSAAAGSIRETTERGNHHGTV